MNRNKLFLLLYILLYACTWSYAQVKILSWNVENLGKSKPDSTLAFIAKTIKEYDIVALQEVVAGYGGAQAVARLADQLNQTGAKWDYTISNPTTSSSYKTERYAYLWKTSKVKKIGEAWLEDNYAVEIDREPYYCTFQYQNNTFTLANFHAITKSKQPETEIKYFKFLPAQYANKKLIFLGDFNCPQSHTVFNPLKKMGYQSAFINQKTTLKQECNTTTCLASEFDNIWYNTQHFTIKNPEALLFYEAFDTLAEAKTISDHIPIAVTLFVK